MLWSVIAVIVVVSTLAVPVLSRADDPARPGMCEAHQRVTNGPAILWPSHGTGPHKMSGGTGASRGNPGTSTAGGITVYLLKDGKTVHHSAGPIGFAHPIQDCAAGKLELRGESESTTAPWEPLQELSQGQ
jgi:hypothetical protein